MKKIGMVACEGAGGPVFETSDGQFFYKYSSIDFDENSRETTSLGESSRFTSLETLIASLPDGVDYLPGGIRVHDPVKDQQMLERFRRISEELDAYHASQEADSGDLDAPDAPLRAPG